MNSLLERLARVTIARGLGFVLQLTAIFFATAAGAMRAQSAALALMVALVGAGLVTYDRHSGPAGAGTIFVVVFGLFHAGLVVAYAFIGANAIVGQGNNAWVVGASFRVPVLATCIGLLTLSAGYACYPKKRIDKSRVVSAEPPSEVDRSARVLHESRLIVVGGLAVAVGIALIFPVLSSAGGLGGGYVDFLEASANSHYGYGTLLFGLGVIFLVHAGGRPRRIGLSLFAMFGVVMLVLGNRGAVIFTSVALFYIAGRRFRWRSIVVGAILVLGLVSVLRQTRLHGLSGLRGGDWSFSPLQGLAELGYSLYPVFVVQRWMETGAEPWYGLSLVAVPLRYLQSLLGYETPWPDYRIFNVEIQERAGAIGGSPIAEGLRNGGFEFLAVLMFGVGLLLGFIQSRSSRLGVLVGATLLLPMLFFVRNSFAPVPVQWAIGITLVLAVTRLKNDQTGAWRGIVPKGEAARDYTSPVGDSLRKYTAR